MKRLFPSLLIALASTAIVAAAPTVTPAVQPVATPAVFPTASPEHLALARQYVALTRTGSDTIAGIRAAAVQAANYFAESIETDAERLAAQTRYYNLVMSNEPRIQALMPRLLDAYAAAYAREYSADELRLIISFADTPAGKHYFAHPDNFEDDAAVIESHKAIGEMLAPAFEQMNKEACGAKAAARVAAGDKHAKCPLAG